MIKKAFFRANIPFTVDKSIVFDSKFSDCALNKNWRKSELNGDFLLKHINTSFAQNVICYSQKCQPINFSIPMSDPYDQSIVRNYCFSVSEMHIYCFDTGVGIFSFHIPYECDTDEEDIVNTCSILRCSAYHENPSLDGKAVFKDGVETRLSCLAQNKLDELFQNQCKLFDLLNDTSLRRIDMFSAVLCDTPNEETDTKSFDKLCYRLANAYDNRDKNLTTHEQDFYRQHEYTRWSFSKRGCAVVANLTGIGITDSFLKERWFFSVNSNYFYLYLMVLHQKYAIYNYLNTVAADASKAFVKVNQEALIEFNSKYIFSIVSDEHFIQHVYLRMQDVNNIKEVYADLMDELKRMFDYTQLKNEEYSEIRNSKLNIISVIISVLCSITIIFDSINLFTTHGYSLGFDCAKNTFCTGVITFEVIVFILFLTFVFFITKSKKK